MLALSLLLSTQPVPIDPTLVLEELAAAYRKGPIAERIDVTVRAAGLEATESLTLFVSEGGEVTIDLGRVTLWIDDGTLRAAHNLDSTSYFEAPLDPGDRGAALAELLPPIPIPHIPLLFSPGAERLADPTPYTTGVRWTGAEIDPSRQPATARLRGEAPGVTVELAAEVEPARLLGFTASLDGGAARFRVVPVPLTGEDARPRALETAGRERVGSIRELAPSAGDLRAERQMPAILAQPASVVTRPDDPAPRAVRADPRATLHVFLRGWSEDAAAAVAAAGALDGGAVGARARVIAVFDLADAAAGLKERLVELEEKVAPLPLEFSVSPATTMERFAPGARVVLVVAGADDRIKAIVNADGRSAEAGSVESAGAAIEAELRRVLAP